MSICLAGACSIFARDQKFSVNQRTSLVAETESGLPESTEEQGGDWLEAHESNGPEGTRGVPMQTMSRFQFGLVLAILVAGGGLVVLVKQDKLQDHE